MVIIVGARIARPLWFALNYYKFTTCTVGRGLAPAETCVLRLQRREQAPALLYNANLFLLNAEKTCNAV